MTGPKAKPLLLMGAGTLPQDVAGWAIHELAQVWREEGLEVNIAAGPQGEVPADLLFLRLGLPVVLEEYLALAARYPVQPLPLASATPAQGRTVRQGDLPETPPIKR